MRFCIIALALLLMTLVSSISADNSGRIYGKIYLTDGDELEGFIRWDKNEGSWVDILNGSKDRNDSHFGRRSSRKRRNRGSVNIFGLKFMGAQWDLSGSVASGIRFGHIKTLEVIDDDRALLYLKSGEEVEFEDGSTDIGDGIREIVVEDRDEGEIELDWEDIDRIEFMESPANETSAFGERLYGTLTTRRGDEFTGYVCWDVDELFTNDILNGDDKRRSRRIKFGKIASIERYSSSAARIILRSGDEMVLRGSNDVDDDNRGIAIADPGIGQVTVEWDDFDKLVFADPPPGEAYSRFDGGRRLKGTVYTEDGDEFTGYIRWDDDEEYTWEILDGDDHDVEFDIEFGLIREIEKKSYRGATVTLRDGRVIRLRGSNDVNEDNKGIIIDTESDGEVYVDWEEFSRIQFADR